MNNEHNIHEETELLVKKIIEWCRPTCTKQIGLGLTMFAKNSKISAQPKCN